MHRDMLKSASMKGTQTPKGVHPGGHLLDNSLSPLRIIAGKLKYCVSIEVKKNVMAT